MTLVRVVRCLCVSVGTTVLSALVLVVLALGFGVTASVANVVAVNLSVLAALWVVQFVVLDRVIFRYRGMEPCPAP
jgi:hypothetical protein